MKLFKDNLKTLPNIDEIERLELFENASPEAIATIENKPGQQGSLAVYYHLAIQHGGISPNAAKLGLDLYAEHTNDARQNPGKHPNIDRLVDVIEGNRFLAVKTIKRN